MDYKDKYLKYKKKYLNKKDSLKLKGGSTSDEILPTIDLYKEKQDPIIDNDWYKFPIKIPNENPEYNYYSIKKNIIENRVNIIYYDISHPEFLFILLLKIKDVCIKNELKINYNNIIHLKSKTQMNDIYNYKYHNNLNIDIYLNNINIYITKITLPLINNELILYDINSNNNLFNYIFIKNKNKYDNIIKNKYDNIIKNKYNTNKLIITNQGYNIIKPGYNDNLIFDFNFSIFDFFNRYYLSHKFFNNKDEENKYEYQQKYSDKINILYDGINIKYTNSGDKDCNIYFDNTFNNIINCIHTDYLVDNNSISQNLTLETIKSKYNLEVTKPIYSYTYKIKLFSKLYTTIGDLHNNSYNVYIQNIDIYIKTYKNDTIAIDIINIYNKNTNIHFFRIKNEFVNEIIKKLKIDYEDEDKKLILNSIINITNCDKLFNKITILFKFNCVIRQFFFNNDGYCIINNELTDKDKYNNQLEMENIIKYIFNIFDYCISEVTQKILERYLKDT